MNRSIKKEWDLIRLLNNNPREKPKLPSITPNQIAHHLLTYGKYKVMKSRPNLVNRELYGRIVTKLMNLEI